MSTDPIGDAVAKGTAAGFAVRAPSREARVEAVRAREEAYAGGNSAAIARLLNFVHDYPTDEVLQRIVARVLDEIGESDNAELAWQGIVKRFPRSPIAFLGLVRAVARRSGLAAARARMESRFSGGPMSFDSALTVAKAWDAIGDAGEASAAFRRLTILFPHRDEAWSAAASRLEAQGFYRSAADLLGRAAETSAWPSPHVRRRREIEDAISRLPEKASRHEARGRVRRSIAVLSGLLEELVSARNEVPSAISPAPRSVVMTINCLGAGGSQRQLVNTALGLRTIRAADPHAPSFDWMKVVVQSCRAQKHDGFFRQRLQLAGVPVLEYEDLPLYGGRFESSAVRSIVPILRFLPLPVLESVLRLTDALRAWRPDVVQIWQEALAFETALAALLARVPRIIACLRSLPAIDRPERYRLEYPVIFHALLAADNVTLCCNTRFAAARYAQWLGIDPARIAVVPNGAAKLPSNGDDASQTLYREFDVRTGPCPLTVGVVMRMDENKRPRLWVKAAAGILEKLPCARFILVGDGPLRRKVMKWTKERGIAHRFLFVGVSHSVGFWLSKMDLFMLLSKQEGLPNALIEAQLSGVPVLITPAGGAPETLIAGVTGIVTDPDPTAEQIATTVRDLVDEPQRLRVMGEAGTLWASESFSMAQMLKNTIAVMAGGRPGAGGLGRQPWAKNDVIEAGGG